MKLTTEQKEAHKEAQAALTFVAMMLRDTKKEPLAFNLGRLHRAKLVLFEKLNAFDAACSK